MAERARPQIRLFDSDFMERFSRVSPRSVALFWGPLSVAMLIAGLVAFHRTPVGIAEVVLGFLLLWTGFEYFFHRVLFHLLARLPGGARFAFVMHGCHHADPMDETRNVMPLVVTIPVGLVIAALSWRFFPFAQCLLPWGVFGLAYLAYDMTHYACHQRAMRGPVGRYLKRHHLRHHHRDSGTNFSVTFPLWDKVFGTYG